MIHSKSVCENCLIYAKCQNIKVWDLLSTCSLLERYLLDVENTRQGEVIFSRPWQHPLALFREKGLL